MLAKRFSTQDGRFDAIKFKFFSLDCCGTLCREPVSSSLAATFKFRLHRANLDKITTFSRYDHAQRSFVRFRGKEYRDARGVRKLCSEAKDGDMQLMPHANE